MALLPIHNFFVFNEKIQPVRLFVPAENEGGIYEVLRVKNGIPLFLEDHLERFEKSAEIAEKNIRFSENEIEELLQNLIVENKVDEGNILISCKLNLKVFFIAHSYPSEEMYKSGVGCGILKAERENPNAKVFQTFVRQKANILIVENGFYEVLLADETGCITEGSRSNVFFVKQGKILTSPGNKVLLGITRQKTIELAKKLEMEVVEQEIQQKELDEFDAAFITGTSPKILPIKKINDSIFDVENSTVRRLMDAYDKMIEEYVAKKSESI